LSTELNKKIEIKKALFNKYVNPENFTKNNATKVTWIVKQGENLFQRLVGSQKGHYHC